MEDGLTARVYWDRARKLLSLHYSEGETESLNLDLMLYGYVLEPGEVFFKDWSGHVGMTGALVEAGGARGSQEDA